MNPYDWGRRQKRGTGLGEIADENGWQGSVCALCFSRKKKNEDTQCWQEIKHVRSGWHAPVRQRMSERERERGSILYVRHYDWVCKAHTYTCTTNTNLSIIPLASMNNWNNHNTVFICHKVNHIHTRSRGYLLH